MAICSGRILCLEREQGTVTFTYKDYKDPARRKTMTLSLPEFLRRFCLHILPERFVKIRNYGLLGNHCRKQKIEHARRLLASASPARADATADQPEALAAPIPAPVTSPLLLCPQCGSASMVLIQRREPLCVVRLDSS